MEKPIEYTTKIGDHLAIWITGQSPMYIAEVTKEEPLELKVMESGPFAHLKDGDYFVMEHMTTVLQRDDLESQRYLFSAKKLDHPFLSGLQSLGIEDGILHEIHSTKVFAPFSPEQVAYLEIWQYALPVHPFDCRNEHEGERTLLPTENGWICSSCDYTQDWCHASMCEKPEWEGIQNELQFEVNKSIMESLQQLYSDLVANRIGMPGMEVDPKLIVYQEAIEQLKNHLDHYEQNGPTIQDDQQAPSSKEVPGTDTGDGG